MKTPRSEGSNKKASKGLLYVVHGGFSIWGGHPMNTEKFERKLSAILSADVKGSVVVG